ncbi:TetR/AcrR family transcriptional regulator [Streptomyces sp. NPDC127051]|uniref:TetR/AcrR family transcriptional regulator n=1 Tax=Streptomyces sp. NPDC127051 TaxID=3347119 RepID=UPI0036599140
MTRETQRPLRADAERNRRLIMETADRMFARRGAAVTLNEIAREAGIGVGTVYRRFPDLQALIDALFTERFTTFLDLAAAAEAQPDPGQALRQYLLQAAGWRARDRALDVILGHASIEAGPISRIGFGLDRAPAAHTSAMTGAQIRRTWPEPAAQQGQGHARDPEGPAGRAPGLS